MMPTFRFAKLLRDKIVDNQIASGAIPIYHQLNEQEHKQALVDKVIEEVQEIIQADAAEVAAELADVQQALDDLREKYGLTDADIKAAQASKARKYGTFKKGLYVESVTLPESDKWTAYYRQNPDRYPEI